MMLFLRVFVVFILISSFVVWVCSILIRWVLAMWVIMPAVFRILVVIVGMPPGILWVVGIPRVIVGVHRIFTIGVPTAIGIIVPGILVIVGVGSTPVRETSIIVVSRPMLRSLMGIPLPVISVIGMIVTCHVTRWALPVVATTIEISPLVIVSGVPQSLLGVVRIVALLVVLIGIATMPVVVSSPVVGAPFPGATSVSDVRILPGDSSVRCWNERVMLLLLM